jgi:hypothetical protein
MSSGGRRGGGVSERDRRRDQTRKHWVAQAPGFTRRTPIDLSGGLNELIPADRREGLLGGRRPRGGNRSISEIPANSR